MIMKFIRWFFTWWNGATMGTQYTLWRHGKFLAEDEFGNRYFTETKARKGMKARRWVVYQGLAEASKVPPEWDAWLHHTVDTPPSEKPPVLKPWEKPNQPNMTGTPFAYRPRGSLGGAAMRPSVSGDYEAWSPDQGHAAGGTK